MKAVLEFASRTWVLGSTFTASLVLFAAISAVPIGGELLDARFGYGYGEAMAALAEYGEQGRRVYAVASSTLDTLLPLAYVAFLAGLIHRLRPLPRLWPCALLPVVVGVADLCENAQIVVMLIQFPDVAPMQVAAASFATKLKVYAAVPVMAVVSAFAAIALWRAVARRTRGTSHSG